MKYITVFLIALFLCVSTLVFAQEKNIENKNDKSKKENSKTTNTKQPKWYENTSLKIAALGYASAIDYKGNIATFGGEEMSRQFNGLLNIEGAAQLQKNISITFLLLAGPAKSDIYQREDSNVSIADLFINIDNIMNSGLNLLFGSYDTPFGDQTKFVTNNAFTFGNPFIMNSLFYSAFGGEVGTLNTMGLKIYKETKIWDLAVSINNGTDEDIDNSDNNFEYVASAGLSLGKWFRFSSSFLYSDDRLTDEKSTGFGAKLTTGIVDARINLPSIGSGTSYIKGYYGLADWDDEKPQTNDILHFWMVECKYTFYKHLYFALRYSSWIPEDHNGDRAGVSEALPTPSTAFAESVKDHHNNIELTTDQTVMRMQAALGYLKNEKLMVKLVGFYDYYEHKSQNHNTDVLGFILAINVAVE